MNVELVDHAGLEGLLNRGGPARDPDVLGAGGGARLGQGAVEAIGRKGEGGAALPDPRRSCVMRDDEDGAWKGAFSGQPTSPSSNMRLPMT